MADVFEDYKGPSREELERQQAAMRAKSARFSNVILGGREEMDAARERLWKVIEQTPKLFWQLLTKRPENMVNMTPERWRNGWPENIIAMTTVENQAAANERIPHLLNVPAKYRGLSCEPLLEPVRLNSIPWKHGVKCDKDKWSLMCNPLTGFRATSPYSGIDNGPKIHWVICGFESGPKKRPFDIQNAYSLRDQCRAAGVRFFMKQLDKVQPIPDDLMIREFPDTHPPSIESAGKEQKNV